MEHGQLSGNRPYRFRCLLQARCLGTLSFADSPPGDFYLLNCFCYFPLLVLKGIHQYWKYFFPGDLSKWKLIGFRVYFQNLAAPTPAPSGGGSVFAGKARAPDSEALGTSRMGVPFIGCFKGCTWTTDI